jgi:hypothetical protein
VGTARAASIESGADALGHLGGRRLGEGDRDQAVERVAGDLARRRRSRARHFSQARRGALPARADEPDHDPRDERARLARTGARLENEGTIEHALRGTTRGLVPRDGVPVEIAPLAIVSAGPVDHASLPPWRS